MLSVKNLTIGQEKYYTNLASAAYYAQGGSEPEGFWLGAGAKHLGLLGKVDANTLSALMKGFGPDGKPLVRNAGQLKGKKSRQAAWDLCFSVPKSVSVLWALSPPSVRFLIEKAIRIAVQKTIEYLEREYGYSRTGRGGAKRVRSKLVVAAFPHATSRMLDPGYHIHCVLLNIGVCQDGKTRTVVSKGLVYESKMLAGSMFRCQLACELIRSLQLKLFRPLDRNGQPKPWFEVHGVSQKLCRFFSQRRQEIEDALGAFGLETAAAAAGANEFTRRSKGTIPAREQLFEQWRRQAEAQGTNVRSLQNALEQRVARMSARRLSKALEEATKRITNEQSSFTERLLLTEVLNACQGLPVDATAVCDHVRHELANQGNYVLLGEQRGQRVYTTPDILAVEQEFLEAARSIHEARFRPLSNRLVDRLAGKTWSPERRSDHGPVGLVKAALGSRRHGFKLNDEQVSALRYLTQSPGRLKTVLGLAGTGKTTLLRATKEAYEKQGYEVIGCAVAGVAAKKLQTESGIRSDTIQSRLMQLYPRPWHVAKHHVKQLLRAAGKKRTYKPNRLRITRKTVLVVDEAGQVGTRDFALLAKAVERGGGILVCVGDDKQLPSIEAGGGLTAVSERFGSVALRDIRRQRDEAQRDVVRRLAEDQTTEVVQDWARDGSLKVAENRQQAETQLVSRWAAEGGIQSPKDHVIFVGTRREVDRYNDLAQQQREEAGAIDTSRSTRVGDELLCVGDRVIFEKKSRQDRLENGDMGTVTAIRTTPLGTDIAIRLDGEEKPRVIPIRRLVGRTYEHIRRAYAFTTHKLQGATVDHAYIHIGGKMTDREMLYVQGSRHRMSCHIYTDQNEAGAKLTNLTREAAGETSRYTPKPGQDPEHSPLLHAVSTSRAKQLALDQKKELEKTQQADH